ncbi:class I SAM-dependent methyltransferase [Aromatoleum toluclasticum]|uniref:class I SAM-dependent methyltransferase n=1 Tax=Aromatoleum toluclasticum TaxID=92003 RepID=UPI001D19587D|nr:class I SAM-dependent methyltransferase [Aromatoleum toluclasticum]MCC4114754.1 class I SAM-dependent methyltransferase [Aromatoleum toluclasticum]
MEKLGPGSDADTLQVLAMIPRDGFSLVVDAGSGIGRQTLALASRLQTTVHAVDTAAKHLDSLGRYSAQLGIEHLVQTHCMDMADIPAIFRDVDLLWSECAAYHIGFPNALASWLHAIRPGGYAVISELSWLRDEVPEHVHTYFRRGYPDMRTVDENLSIAHAAGYEVIATHILSRAAWIDGYYDKLEPLARSLLDHPEQAVRTLAAQTLEGIHVFDSAADNYGYVFYVLRKPVGETTAVA